MRWLAFCVLIVCGVLLSQAASSDESARSNAAPLDAQRIEHPGLPNAYRVTPQVISGGLPESDEAFQQLRELGVKTVISVDGARPDVETAARHGLRYVHLPHGYDGIPAARLKELAKAVRDLPGPIYVHCHHGKHRSPAAVATACVATGSLSNEQAMQFLTLAGTSPNYRGLYQSVKEARLVGRAELDALPVEWRTVAEVPPMAEAMVVIEHIHDRLKKLASAEWRVTPAEGAPPNSSFVEAGNTAAHEALLLGEHFTELLRTSEVQSQPTEFRKLLEESEREATQLEELLAAERSAASTSEATKSLDKISQDCASCHQKFRDTPLAEKNARR